MLNWECPYICHIDATNTISEIGWALYGKDSEVFHFHDSILKSIALLFGLDCGNLRYVLY